MVPKRRTLWTPNNLEGYWVVNARSTHSCGARGKTFWGMVVFMVLEMHRRVHDRYSGYKVSERICGYLLLAGPLKKGIQGGIGKGLVGIWHVPLIGLSP